MASVFKGFRETRYDFQKSWNDGLVFPLVLVQEDCASKDAAKVGELIHQNASLLDSALAKHGAILFRGLNLRNAEDFSKVVSGFGWAEFKYTEVGGVVTRAKVSEKVLTVNDDIPLEEALHFHNEAVYLPKPPSKIVFFCQQPPASGTGGRTFIVQGSAIYERMLKEYESLMLKLEKGVRRLSTDTNRRKNPGLQKVISKDSKGQMAWYNSIGAAVSYRTPLAYEDGSPVSQEAFDAFLKVSYEEKVAFSWMAGDMLVIDNSSVLHAKEASYSPRTIFISLAK